MEMCEEHAAGHQYSILLPIAGHVGGYCIRQSHNQLQELTANVACSIVMEISINCQGGFSITALLSPDYKAHMSVLRDILHATK